MFLEARNTVVVDEEKRPSARVGIFRKRQMICSNGWMVRRDRKGRMVHSLADND